MRAAAALALAAVAAFAPAAALPVPDAPDALLGAGGAYGPEGCDARSFAAVSGAGRGDAWTFAVALAPPLAGAGCPTFAALAFAGPWQPPLGPACVASLLPEGLVFCLRQPRLTLPLTEERWWVCPAGGVCVPDVALLQGSAQFAGTPG